MKKRNRNTAEKRAYNKIVFSVVRSKIEELRVIHNIMLKDIRKTFGTEFLHKHRNISVKDLQELSNFYRKNGVEINFLELISNINN